MNTVAAEWLVAGSCTHPEHVVHKNWRLRPLTFPATFALIRHPDEGLMLYDTGYSKAFFEATRGFPERLYRFVTPVRLESGQTAAEQLRARGIDPASIAKVLVSHFHADHIGGINDFPRATFVFLEEAWNGVRHLRGLRALTNGYLPALVPQDFAHRGNPVDVARPIALPPELAPFSHGFDLFGDQSMYAVRLGGHAAGQMGLVLRLHSGRLWFLVADACWTSRCYREAIPPHLLTRILFHNTAEYKKNLTRIGEVSKQNDALRIFPSHCLEMVTSADTDPLDLVTQ